MTPIEEVPIAKVDEFFVEFCNTILERVAAGNLTGPDALALDKWIKYSPYLRLYIQAQVSAARGQDGLISFEQIIRGTFMVGFMLAQFVDRERSS